MYFNEAQMYVDNTDTSIVQDINQRTIFLNMITAHIAFLNSPLSTGVNSGTAPSSPLVGRISNATEGSVNVTTEMKLPEGSAQWFAQSKYGIAFWQASSVYRTMHYLPGPRRNFSPFAGTFPGFRFGNGFNIF